MTFHSSSRKGMSRRNFLRTATVGGLATATAMHLGMPRLARAQDIKGTDLTILWLMPSIPESAATRQKAMEEWAAAAGVNLTLETIALDKLAEKLATMAEIKAGADLVEMYSMDVAVNA